MFGVSIRRTAWTTRSRRQGERKCQLSSDPPGPHLDLLRELLRYGRAPHRPTARPRWLDTTIPTAPAPAAAGVLDGEDPFERHQRTRVPRGVTPRVPGQRAAAGTPAKLPKLKGVRPSPGDDHRRAAARRRPPGRGRRPSARPGRTVGQHQAAGRVRSRIPSTDQARLSGSTDRNPDYLVTPRHRRTPLGPQFVHTTSAWHDRSLSAIDEQS
jgi:hypothetical protein